MYLDDFRRWEAFCEKRCAWTDRSATREGARLLGDAHHDRTANAAGFGHLTGVREVAR